MILFIGGVSFIRKWRDSGGWISLIPRRVRLEFLESRGDVATLGN
jgi:hypothetical protein